MWQNELRAQRSAISYPMTSSSLAIEASKKVEAF